MFFKGDRQFALSRRGGLMNRDGVTFAAHRVKKCPTPARVHAIAALSHTSPPRRHNCGRARSSPPTALYPVHHRGTATHPKIIDRNSRTLPNDGKALELPHEIPRDETHAHARTRVAHKQRRLRRAQRWTVAASAAPPGRCVLKRRPAHNGHTRGPTHLRIRANNQLSEDRGTAGTTEPARGEDRASRPPPASTRLHLR